MAKTNFSSLLEGYLESGDTGPEGEVVQRIPLDRIIEDPENPRRHFDEADIQDMAASVRERGVIQPISVRPPNTEGLYVIRFGHRRFRGAQLAGLADIRAIVTESDEDPADVLVDQLIENDQRAALSTADMAHGVGRLLALGMKQAEVAQRLGRRKDEVSRLASVLKMPEPLQELAKTAGLGTVTTLHQAWKADAQAVETYLAQTEPEAVTQAAARALAARLTQPEPPPTAPEAKAGSSAAPASGTREAAGEEEPSPKSRANGKGTGKRGNPAPVLVEVNGRRGRLAAETILVVFDDTGATEEARLAQVRFVGGGEG